RRRVLVVSPAAPVGARRSGRARAVHAGRQPGVAAAPAGDPDQLAGPGRRMAADVGPVLRPGRSVRGGPDMPVRRAGAGLAGEREVPLRRAARAAAGKRPRAVAGKPGGAAGLSGPPAWAARPAGRLAGPGGPPGRAGA